MSIVATLEPPVRNLGDGFQVRRALPSPRYRTVGPFVFFDQMGPTRLAGGKGLDVRPHPHIGLATVTYLFEGSIMHRDSLGSVQIIRPSEVNWMVAGSGIVHSERTPLESRAAGPALFGLQCWIGLPRSEEECAPAFDHYPSAALPRMDERGASLRLIAGTWQKARSPVHALSEMVYADITLDAGARIPIFAEHVERALYIVKGPIEIDSQRLEEGRMVILESGKEMTVAAHCSARVMLLGGAPLDGPRHLWWNFVSSSTERIEQAKADWRAQRLGRVEGDDEFIPLPEEPPATAPVRYP